MRASIVCITTLAAISFPAFAQTLSLNDQTLAAYRENSWALYGDGDTFNLDDILLVAAKSHKQPDAVVGDFAKRIGATEIEARAYAELIVTLAIARETCGDNNAECPLNDGESLMPEIERLGLVEPTGGLIFAAGVYVGHDQHLFGDLPAMAALAARHPRASELLARLYAYGHDTPYLISMIASGNLTTAEAMTIAEHADQLPPEAVVALLATGKINAPLLAVIASNGAALANEADRWDGWVEAMLIDAEPVARQIGPAAHASLAQALLLTHLEAGNTDEAVTYWLQLSPDVRRLLPLKPDSCPPGLVCGDADATAYRFIDWMSAALWLSGRDEEARVLTEHVSDKLRARTARENARRDALLDAITPLWPATDLFIIYLDTPQPEDDDEIGPFADDSLSALRSESRALRQLVAERLRAAGYPSMAVELLREFNRDMLPYWEKPRAQEYAAILPSRLAGAQAEWLTRREQARTQPRDAQHDQATRIHTAPLEPWWLERPLAPGVLAWTVDEEPPALPDDVDLPVPPYAILRFDESANGTAIVYESADYDLPGEVPAFGLWFAQKVDDVWHDPIYLGLQTHFPYVVTAGSRMPMLSGDGVLQLEVRIEEIDAASITFPPIGLSLKRQEAGLFLEFDIARLINDRDNDHLTDIEERRLGLDFTRADTDGDGMLDGLDPMPLQPRAGTGDDLSAAVASAIVKELTGHDAGAIVVSADPDSDDLFGIIGAPPAPRINMPTMFLVSDPDKFANLSPPFRLIVYSEADMARLNTGTSPFMPPEIMQFHSSLDGRTHKIVWSAGWVGGAFLVRCSADNICQVETVSDWIT